MKMIQSLFRAARVFRCLLTGKVLMNVMEDTYACLDAFQQAPNNEMVLRKLASHAMFLRSMATNQPVMKPVADYCHDVLVDRLGRQQVDIIFRSTNIFTPDTFNRVAEPSKRAIKAFEQRYKIYTLN
jgi:hypothetical protein